MKRLAAILILLVGLANAGHVSVMMSAFGHVGSAHAADASVPVCPLQTICLSSLAATAVVQGPLVSVFTLLLIVIAVGVRFPVLAAFRPLAPVFIRSGTSFPALLSVFKKE